MTVEADSTQDGAADSVSFISSLLRIRAIQLSLAMFLAACRHDIDVYAPPPPKPLPVNVEGPLVFVPQRSLQTLPTHIDPSGRWIAICGETDSCPVWDLRSMIFRGMVPAARCANWLPLPAGSVFTEPKKESRAQANTSPAARSTSSPSGQSVAEINRGELLIHRRGQTIHAAAGCQKGPCPPITAVVYSPSETQLAVLRQDQQQIHIVDVEDGRTVNRLSSPHDRKIVGRLIAWGPAGIMAIVAMDPPIPVLASDPEDAEKGYLDHTKVATLELWKNLDEHALFLLQVRIQRGSEELALDPRGRWLFQTIYAENPYPVDAFHINAQEDSAALRKTEAIDSNCLTIRADSWDGELQLTEFTHVRWSGDSWPIWEVFDFDAHHNCGDGCAPVYRIQTGPARRRLERKREPPPADLLPLQNRLLAAHAQRQHKPLSANERGSTVDPKGRWEATGIARLRRLSDGEELILYPPSCPHTARGVFDAEDFCLDEGVFLLGPDPLTARVLKVAELASLLHHPGLVDDFFEGRPVQPRPFETADSALRRRLH